MAETLTNGMNEWTRRLVYGEGSLHGRVLGTGGGVISGQDELDPLDHLNVFLVQAVVILSICRALGFAGTYLGQPKVIFEIVGGIILGPSAIGKNVYYLERIFPSSSLGHLKLVAELGLVLYLFLVGLELDVPKLMDHGSKAVSIALMGMAIPFGLGIAISKILFDTLQGSDPLYDDVRPAAFFVFIGVAMCITAFPVLARILKEGGLIYTKVGSIVMGAAALNDAVAWCLLILAISLANAGDMSVAAWVFLSVVAFALGLWFIVRPGFEKLVSWMESHNTKAMRNHMFAMTLILVFLSSWTTSLLGLDAIFGSFLFGLIIPRESKLFHDCNEWIEEYVLTFTLPLYFALSGLKTDVTQIKTGSEIAMAVLVIFVATIGKFVGCGGMAWFSGFTLRESSVIAVLMNTRGLVELIVLNLGMQAGILNVRTFSVMVIMCLATTFMTCPILELIYPVHMRVDMRMERKSDGGGGNNDNEGNDEGSEMIEHHDVDLASKKRNLGLIVDRIEFIQYSIDLLALYTASARGSSLSVTAVKLFPPSFSDQDHLISYNSDGRLVSLEEEPVTFEEMNKLTFFALNKGTSKYVGKGAGQLMPMMFPLSLACNAFGVPIRAFDIKGRPNEFPVEVAHLLSQHESEFAIVPWRDSKFFETFFWDTLKKFKNPIGLYMCRGSYMYEFADSLYEHASASVSASTTTAAASDADIATSAEDNTHNRSGMSRASERKASIVMNDYDPVASGFESTRIHNIFAIVSGQESDLCVYSSVLRFLENPLISITLVIRKADVTDPNYIAFSKAIVDKARCTVSEVSSWSLDSLKEQLVQGERKYQLIIHSVMSSDMISPTSKPTAASASASASANYEESPHEKKKLGSIFNVISEQIHHSPGVQDHRISLRIPNNLMSSNLLYPELGVVGDFILKARKSEPLLADITVLIFHSNLSVWGRTTAPLPAQSTSTSTAVLQPFEVDKTAGTRDNITGMNAV